MVLRWMEVVLRWMEIKSGKACVIRQRLLDCCAENRQRRKMAGHGHSHGCGGHSHSHDDLEGAERGNQFNLYLKIHHDNVQCLNEVRDGSGKDVFKPWDQRLDTEKFVESDADEELLFNIPFTGNVKLKGFIVIGGEDDFHPAGVKLYKNRPHMTFDDAGAHGDQEFELTPDHTGVIEYKVNAARFSCIQHLSMYFHKNHGADTTKVYYIGLKGDFTEAHRHEVTITTYEARANPADHKTNLLDTVPHQIQ